MRRMIKAGVLIMAGALLPAVSMAAGMPEPKVEYSADSRMETEGMVMTTKVYHAKQKERMEIGRGARGNVTIMRRDKKVTWVLMPDQKMYMEMVQGEAGRQKGMDVNDCSIQQTAAGSETINGIRTSKSKVSMACPNDLKYDGTMWTTKDGIMVKMDAVAKAEDRDLHMKIELQNLKIAKQDPKLFEVPAGYRKIEQGGFGAVNAMIRDAQERAKRKEASSESQDQQDPSAGKGEQSEGKGRDYTDGKRAARKAQKKEEAAAAPASNGRDYTSTGRDDTSVARAEKSSKGRDYTSKPRSSMTNPVDAVKGGIKSLLRW